MNKNLKIVIFILLFIIVFLLGMLLGMQIQGKWDKAETNKSASGSAEAQIDEETGEILEEGQPIQANLFVQKEEEKQEILSIVL